MDKKLFTQLSGVTFLTIMCCMLFYNVVSLIKVDSISTSHNNCINSEKCVYCIKQNCYVCCNTFHRGKKNQTNKQTKMLHYINQYMFCTLSHLLINKNKRKTVHNLLTVKSGLGPWLQSWFISPMVISPENFKCAQWVIMCSTSSAHRSRRHPLLPEEKLPYYSTVPPFHDRANVKCHP